MNMKVAATLALLGLAFDASSAFFFIPAATTAAGATAATTSTLTIGGGSAVALGGGLLLLKGLAIGALALAAASRSSGRGRRAALNVEDSDAAFALLASTEPAQCYRRLICDLATGAMPRSENDVILSLFDKDAPIESQRFEFASAAKLGKQVQSVQLCEVRYSCPLTGSQIQQLVA